MTEFSFLGELRLWIHWGVCWSKFSSLICYFVLQNEYSIEQESYTEPTALFSCLQKVREIKADNYHSVSSGWTCSAWYVWDYSWNPWPCDSYDRGAISDPAETFIPLLMQRWRSLMSQSWVMWGDSFPSHISIWHMWSRWDDFIWKVKEIKQLFQ